MSEPTEPLPLSIEFGTLLREAREARGLSRRELARQAGRSNVSLLQYEHGTANPTLSKAVEIAELYGIDLRLVLGG